MVAERSLDVEVEKMLEERLSRQDERGAGYILKSFPEQIRSVVSSYYGEDPHFNFWLATTVSHGLTKGNYETPESIMSLVGGDPQSLTEVKRNELVNVFKEMLEAEFHSWEQENPEPDMSVEENLLNKIGNMINNRSR